jgi:hypothetical protein
MLPPCPQHREAQTVNLLPILFPIFFPNLDQSFTVLPPQLFTNLFYRGKTAWVLCSREHGKRRYPKRRKTKWRNVINDVREEIVGK